MNNSAKYNQEELLFDSRSLVNPEKTVFFAIKTSAADGHNYIKPLYEKGVRRFVVENLPEGSDSMPDAEFIMTDSVRDEIERLAREKRASLKGTVIGITGSAAKTVVKEMVYKALVRKGFSVSRSPRSWNSRLGAPMSLLEARADDFAVIVEAGIDAVGDMNSHAAIIKPEIGVLTAVTSEHDAGFESREEKIREKLLLFAASKTIVYDATSPDVDKTVRSTYPDKRLVGIKGDSPLDTDRRIAEAVVSELGVGDAFVELENVTNRIDVHEGVNDCVMLFDDFTNDLRSLRWALDFMRRRSDGRGSTLIMSDLFHGPADDAALRDLYSQLGLLLDAFGIDRLIAIGPELGKYRSAIPGNIRVENVETADDFLMDYDITRFSSETILISGAPQKDFEEIRSALESPRHDTILEVNLDALVHNFNYFRSMLRPATGLIAMIKASAYGAGAVEVAKTLQAQGARYLAVAVIDEGIELRKHGVTMPVMVLNPVTTNYRALFRYGLEPSVFSLRELDTLVGEAKLAGVKEFSAHIKLDTGMHRVGFAEDEVERLVERLNETPELKVASIFSHLATADCPDESEYTRMQLDTFGRVSEKIIQSLGYPALRHILNTAGIMTHPESQYDMVRLGIGLYGVSPFGKESGLRPVSTLKTTIISIKDWKKGTTIGYARRGLLKRDSKIATLPIGYADGVDRHLSRGAVGFMVRGMECPTVGNICMDQCMIDVTDVSDVKIGDEVEIFGNLNRVEKIAGILDTIPYEVLTSVSPRVRRIYYRD